MCKRKKFIFASIIFMIVATESQAYAYLDPGTGNALIAILMSVIGALFFVFQGIYYKLTGKKQNESVSRNAKGIVIFSEGKNYWLIWKGIVEKLIEKKQYFTYYTMDLYDPCLDIVSPFMDNRYIGSGNFAYAKINHLSAKVLLATTPNFGANDYPVKKSKNVANLVHIYHALDDGSFYKKNALDEYDTILLSGECQIPVIKKLNKLRNLKEKTLIPAGLPYLDEMAKELKNFRIVSNAEDSNGKTTILIAPSWGSKNSLTLYGLDFVKKLAVEDYNIILRPHPHSMKVEKDLILGYQEDLSSFKNISWDFEVDASASFSKADIMVSDISGIRLDFVVLYQKPVVTLETPFTYRNEYEVEDIGYSWNETVANDIGVYVPEEKIDDIVAFVQQALAKGTTENLIAFREKNLYNFGNSAEVIANYLIEQLNEKAR